MSVSEGAVKIQRSFRASLTEGVRKGLLAVWFLSKVIVPVYLVVDILRYFGVIEVIAKALEPFMGLFGLPGEAALGLIGGALINLYAAIGAVAPLDLTPREITIMGLMLGISHGLILETAITKQFAQKWYLMPFLRILVALFAGVLANLVFP